jgi:hypothetical protein
MLQRRIKRFVKQTPVAWRTVSRLRARIAPILQRVKGAS